MVLALAAQGAAGFFLVRVEGQKAAARESLDALVRDSGRVQALVGELRSAEAGVVATGQDATEWVPRLAGLMDMVLLVIESEKTNQDVVKKVNALLKESKANVSTVLNKTHNYVPEKLHQEYLHDA